jgi:hypothetical protein
MFIKDGKTLFGNSGLIFSLLILLILLYFSYNKCYINNDNNNNNYNYNNNVNNVNNVNSSNNLLYQLCSKTNTKTCLYSSSPYSTIYTTNPCSKNVCNGSLANYAYMHNIMYGENCATMKKSHTNLNKSCLYNV